MTGQSINQWHKASRFAVIISGQAARTWILVTASATVTCNPSSRRASRSILTRLELPYHFRSALIHISYRLLHAITMYLFAIITPLHRPLKKSLGFTGSLKRHIQRSGEIIFFILSAFMPKCKYIFATIHFLFRIITEINGRFLIRST